MKRYFCSQLLAVLFLFLFVWQGNTAVPPAQQDNVVGLKRLELRIPAWTIENDKTVIRVRLVEN